MLRVDRDAGAEIDKDDILARCCLRLSFRLPSRFRRSIFDPAGVRLLNGEGASERRMAPRSLAEGIEGRD